MSLIRPRLWTNVKRGEEPADRRRRKRRIRIRGPTHVQWTGLCRREMGRRGIGLIHDKRNNEGSPQLVSSEFFLCLL
ncbi:hypothetical protein Naga_101373g1 [Nannochloropsis gaditana]|uniref:Uncharacterized protein n=1 Tax=Nannochloropsis gaditana TaxID=72520 RepID=W7SZ78_9STRA|nr:hypothetical protein Naga_101373g1 [Nannochloropsis gaditana]